MFDCKNIVKTGNTSTI